jgi:outer membrane receptor protein involved in Fe transport
LGLLARLNYYSSTKSEFIAGASLPPFFQDFSLFPPGAPPGTFQPFITTPDGFTGVNANEMFHDIGDAFILDLELSYDVTDNLQIAVGANNIFDTLPDPISGNAGVRYITDGVVVVEPLAGGPPRLNASFGNAIYPFRGVAFGLNGGYYYLRANYRFDHL